MHEMFGSDSANPTHSPDSGTGPAAEASMGAANCGICGIDPGAAEGDCSAVVQVRITRNEVVFTATLNMGQQYSKELTWKRHRGSERGWVCNRPAEFIGFEDEIGRELAEYADGLNFPYAVANMLPGKRAGAAAVAEAAKAVQA